MNSKIQKSVRVLGPFRSRRENVVDLVIVVFLFVICDCIWNNKNILIKLCVCKLEHFRTQGMNVIFTDKLNNKNSSANIVTLKINVVTTRLNWYGNVNKAAQKY